MEESGGSQGAGNETDIMGPFSPGNTINPNNGVNGENSPFVRGGARKVTKR